MLSRTKPAQTTGNAIATETKKSKVPSLEDFIKNRDFTGALTLLEVRLKQIYFYFIQQFINRIAKLDFAILEICSF